MLFATQRRNNAEIVIGVGDDGFTIFRLQIMTSEMKDICTAVLSDEYGEIIDSKIKSINDQGECDITLKIITDELNERLYVFIDSTTITVTTW